MGGKVISPCVGVCKYKLAGHCIGCAMTKTQKKAFKKLKGKKSKRKFLHELVRQQATVGLRANWVRAYRRRCKRKGVECPLDA